MKISIRFIFLLSLFFIASLPFDVFASERMNAREEPISPIPQHHGQDPAKVILGKQLFHDPGLSGNGTISCASCHAIHNAGVDGLEKSFGINGQRVGRNSPTVLNSGLLFSQFWDRRAASLEEQIEGPLNDSKEMGSNWEKALAYLNSKEIYLKQFERIYGAPPRQETVKDAIAVYERSLLTPNGPFDRYLGGEEEAISSKAEEGCRLFKSYGCSSCHQGVAVGGNMYEKLGIVTPFFGVVREPTKSDLGRFNLTGNEAHRYEFKVPSLRNVARTAPYLHDGSIATLEEMVSLMAMHQLGRKIPEAHINKIIAFLKTLSGDLSE